MRAIRALKELRPHYQTNLFEESDWLHWDYDNPYNLNHIKNEMMREPNERVYLEIHPTEGTYTVCNRWTVIVHLRKIREQSCLQPHYHMRKNEGITYEIY